MQKPRGEFHDSILSQDTVISNRNTNFRFDCFWKFDRLPPKQPEIVVESSDLNHLLPQMSTSRKVLEEVKPEKPSFNY